MHTRDSNLNNIVSKVPQVTLAFWIIKILATTLGETGGDAVTMSWLGDCRHDDRRHDAGRLLHAIARHRLYRRFHHLAHLCDCVASDLALGDGKHIDRNCEYAEGRNFLLGDNHVLPDLGDGAWRLGGRYE